MHTPNNNTYTPNNNTHSPPYHLSTLSPLMPESRHQKKNKKLLLALLAHPPNTLSPLPDPHKHPSHNCLCHRCNSCILNPLTITVTLTTALPHQPPCRCIATIATTVPAPPYRHGATKATTATTVPPCHLSCPFYHPNVRLSLATLYINESTVRSYLSQSHRLTV